MGWNVFLAKPLSAEKVGNEAIERQGKERFENTEEEASFA